MDGGGNPIQEAYRLTWKSVKRTIQPCKSFDTFHCPVQDIMAKDYEAKRTWDESTKFLAIGGQATMDVASKEMALARLGGDAMFQVLEGFRNSKTCTWRENPISSIIKPKARDAPRLEAIAIPFFGPGNRKLTLQKQRSCCPKQMKVAAWCQIAFPLIRIGRLVYNIPSLQIRCVCSPIPLCRCLTTRSNRLFQRFGSACQCKRFSSVFRDKTQTAFDAFFEKKLPCRLG